MLKGKKVSKYSITKLLVENTFGSILKLQALVLMSWFGIFCHAFVCKDCKTPIGFKNFVLLVEVKDVACYKTSSYLWFPNETLLARANSYSSGFPAGKIEKGRSRTIDCTNDLLSSFSCWIRPKEFVLGRSTNVVPHGMKSRWLFRFFWKRDSMKKLTWSFLGLLLFLYVGYLVLHVFLWSNTYLQKHLLTITSLTEVAGLFWGESSDEGK